MRKALYAVLAAGLFLLMLSALVVAPEQPKPLCSAPLPADLQAAFRPQLSAILPDAADMDSGRSDMRPALSLLPVLLLAAVFLLGVRDANGRLLTAARYENSVYQLFRPEVAGG